MDLNLDNLTLDELNELSKSVNLAISSSEAKRLTAARSALEDLAREHGFTLAELVDPAPKGKRSTKALAPKFVNPNNPIETWSGRGRKPKWFLEGLAAGKKPEEFLLSS
jgi:DNA-binding protein H-NS